MRTAPRRGLTLIELVMVVSLLVLLAAIAIPGVQMAVEGRRVREAARAVNVYLGAARNRAMATGRTVGVAFERFDNESNMSITLHQVESPPDYGGETINSRAEVMRNGTGNNPVQLQVRFPDGGFASARVRPGDYIQFNHQGYWYRIVTATDTALTASLSVPATQAVPWSTTNWSAPMPYTIRRQPALPGSGSFQVALAKPVQLPLDAVVDMTFSGGSGNPIPRNAFAGGTAPVVILFSPNGGLERVYYAGGSYPATESVYLLIGKRERIPPGNAEDGMSNLRDPENLWISISPRSGLVGTAENALVTDDTAVFEARVFARGADSMGGR